MLKLIRVCWVAGIMAAAFFVNSIAYAHGGVSLEDDLCIMQIGQYRAHFTGYQPKARASQEFCEDIPELGEAIIVLDFLDAALRGMQIEFQVLSNPSDKGAKTVLEDISVALENESHRILKVDAEKYSSGSFSAELLIETPGWYVGVLTATAPERGAVEISVFPFSVGMRDYSGLIAWLVAIVILSVIFYFASARRQNQS